MDNLVTGCQASNGIVPISGYDKIKWRGQSWLFVREVIHKRFVSFELCGVGDGKTAIARPEDCEVL
ncbi:hypothetical protein GCM10016455_03730 [Aliiroseovarius zhejiangensis]|uniref:Transposase n=1 Tax=Aliiroseovarius zhejiangensis TaxID=1632025 RepID=A0ABQ3ILB5_9RHOB|nr:hypothetical protein [Aliiroseovarius zhejiangensis]GHE87187.1 hypothetical protein GCM10016455_03730 [Aliiroseovarius zhejiangensis]